MHCYCQSSFVCCSLASVVLVLGTASVAMAPKRKPGQLPKACEDLKSACGGSMTADSIGGADRALRTRASSALNSTLKTTNPDKYKEFLGLQDDEEKREWLAAFIVDPESGGSVVRNTTARTITRTKRGRQQWMTIAEFGGPKGINSLEHATIRCESGEFLKKIHTNEALAKKGVHLYHVTIDDADDTSNALSQSAAVETQAELEAQHVPEVKALMENFHAVEVPKAAKQRRTTATPRTPYEIPKEPFLL